MNLDLTGKTAVVCGSTQGIGMAAANELAQLGANLVLVARNEDKLKSVIKSFDPSNSGRHSYVVADFSDPKDLESKMKAFAAKMDVHVLINNTGGPAGGQAINADTSEFENAFRNHLICNHVLVQSLYEGMKRNGYGRIINVISTSVKQPLPNLGVSNTIRGAVANWSKTLANELGQFNITVNNVLPGATDTTRLSSIIKSKSERTGISEEQILKEMSGASPMQRIAKPEEVANAIAFLASPAASYINGVNIPVDGGRTKSL